MVKRMTAILLILATLIPVTLTGALADTGDRIHFVPTRIIVKTSSVTVEGYFVNLNTNCDVKNFSDFKMSVYKNGSLLVNGSFGEIHHFTVYAMGTKYQSFTFNGYHDLRNGTYECDDSYYCKFSCRFIKV